MTKRLPFGAEAILDFRKIEAYCLNPTHPRGRHKARVFREALDLKQSDATWLRDVLLKSARFDEALQVTVDRWGIQWRLDTAVTRQGRSAVVRSLWIVRTGERVPRSSPAECYDASEGSIEQRRAISLDVVALLTDVPSQRLARGQVGTIIEQLDQQTSPSSSATIKGAPTRSHRAGARICWSCITSLRRPDPRRAARTGAGGGDIAAAIAASAAAAPTASATTPIDGMASTSSWCQ